MPEEVMPQQVLLKLLQGTGKRARSIKAWAERVKEDSICVGLCMSGGRKHKAAPRQRTAIDNLLQP